MNAIRGSLDETRVRLIEHLQRSQGSDGGFGPAAGRPSATEATALATLALANSNKSHGLNGAVAWLLEHQEPTGAWTSVPGVAEGAWATPWALLALSEVRPGEHVPLEAGARFLVAREGSRPPFWALVASALLPEDQGVGHDRTISGWPWHEGSASWVEPTALSMIALRRIRPGVPGVDARLGEGVRLLRDRRCVDGGWNYGNVTVLGEDLPPFADLTGLALMALQDPPEAIDSRSFEVLESLLAEEASGLALSLGILALALHGLDADRWRLRLADRYQVAGFLGETRTLALAILALGDGHRHLRRRR